MIGSVSGKRLIGQAVSKLITRVPASWPLLRGPTRSFFDRRARGWAEATTAGSPTHLAPLAAASFACPASRSVHWRSVRGSVTAPADRPRVPTHACARNRHLGGDDPTGAGEDRPGSGGRVAFRVADGAALPYDDDSFDLVAHLNTPPFFAEVARVLGPAASPCSLRAGTRDAVPHPRCRTQAGLPKVGLEPIETGAAAEGTYFVARLPA